jgi:hypothetical protein
MTASFLYVDVAFVSMRETFLYIDVASVPMTASFLYIDVASVIGREAISIQSNDAVKGTESKSI